MNETITSDSATAEPRERAILVGVQLPANVASFDATLAELSRLADTAGADTAAVVTQRLDAPTPRTYIGSGKVREIASLAEQLEADLIVFDEELTPTQQVNLERALPKGVKVIDRTALILDIFALHATSREGRLQVRLAQNQYLLPRLKGMWAHLASNHMGGGVGSRFGEGESQLEVDRRIVRARITSIKRELAHLQQVRATQRDVRWGSGIFRVALAGYTNAGKSSLLNRLCDADVLSYDKLFATLDSTTRRFCLEGGREVTLTDTVGFIQKLPTTLVEAFKSTLDEVRGADLILHVVDASSPERAAQIAAVEAVLAQIGADGVRRLEVFNKCDLCSPEELAALRAAHPEAVFVSALTGEGVAGEGGLLARIAHLAAEADQTLDMVIPYGRGDLVSLAHERCHILSEEYREDGVALTLVVPASLRDRFAQ